MTKICIVVGTRPEIIKMSSIIRYLKDTRRNHFIVHTNQHYDKEMDEIFFKELGLPQPNFNLKIKSGSHAKMLSDILPKLEKILEKEKPDIVLAEGDTSSVFATALVAKKLHFKFGHIESGLRSRDMNMPEELNRIMVDHISDFLFAPTEEAADNLKRENVYGKIFLTGNTIVDAVLQNLKISEKKSKIIKKLNIKPKDYFLLTFHREENVDNKERFKQAIKNLTEVSYKYKKEIIFPIHPRTQKMADRFKIFFPIPSFRIIEPVGYLDMLLLVKNAAIIFTDSGGLQEESCILKTPCITLRDNTERPETLEIGSNFLVGIDKKKMMEAIELSFSSNYNWKNPYGDGIAGKKIIEAINNEL